MAHSPGVMCGAVGSAATGVIPAARVGPIVVDVDPISRPLAHQAKNVKDARAEDEEVDHDKGDQRGADRIRLQRR